MSNQSEDKKWLVKNNDRIIGPFTESELKEELSKGYISPLATACVPGQEFWIFIAAYPEFVHYTDITKLTQYTSSLRTGFTKTGTFTGKSTAPGVEQTDKTASFINQGLPYQVIEESPGLRTQLEKRKNQKIISFLITISALAIFIIGLFFVFFHEDDDKSMLSRLGQDHFSVGNYSTALQVWTEDNKQNRLSKNDKTSFQALKFQLSNDLSKAAALINLGAEWELDSNEVKNIVQALIQLKTDGFSSARSLLTELVNNSQSQKIKQSAFANLALVSAKIGKCDFFEKYTKDIFDNRNLVYFAFSLCLLRSETLSVDQKKEAENLLQEITQKPRNYYQESLVGLAYIKLQRGEEAVPMIKKILDSNPYLTDSHYYDIFIDRKVYSWPDLLPLCEKIYSYNKDHKIFVSFYAYCLARSHQYESAQNFIKKASLIDSMDILVKSVHAYITDFTNLKSQSVLILGDAIRSNSDMLYILPYILQAQFCERAEDWECAIKNWRIILNNVPDSLSGLGGMAYAQYSQGEYMEARGYVERGFVLDITKHYSPLLFVEKMLKENENK